MHRLLLVLPLALLCSCVDFPNQYAPTRARRPDTGPRPGGLKVFVDMKDPASLAHFAWGIHPAAFDGEKRKAEPKAALRFFVQDASRQKLSLDVFAAEAQLVRLKVNGRLLGEFNAVSNAHLEVPVPPGALVPDTATLVEIESQSGLSLYRVGFVRQ